MSMIWQFLICSRSASRSACQCVWSPCTHPTWTAFFWACRNGCFLLMVAFLLRRCSNWSNTFQAANHPCYQRRQTRQTERVERLSCFSNVLLLSSTIVHMSTTTMPDNQLLGIEWWAKFHNPLPAIILCPLDQSYHCMLVVVCVPSLCVYHTII